MVHNHGDDHGNAALIRSFDQFILFEMDGGHSQPFPPQIVFLNSQNIPGGSVQNAITGGVNK